MTCRKISLQGIVYLLLLLHGEDLVGQTGNSLGNGSVHNPKAAPDFESYQANAGLLPAFDPRKRSSHSNQKSSGNKKVGRWKV